ncbi:MAG: SAM-dependent methyltransferase [Pseudomonadota bacterium]
MSLLDHLLARIQLDGPISVADYMSDCLLHPTFGYYTTRDPLGAQGDFTTAPEISQMFGELTGLCLAQCWLNQGRPSECVLAELGPGRGTLMADILRATRSVRGFADAAQIHLIEASPVLREKQAQALQAYTPHWIDSVSDLPDLPVFLIANEFFDALPIRQFVRDGDGWRERLIGAQQGQLTFGLGPNVPQAALAGRLTDTQDGDLVELRAAAVPVVESIADRIATRGGAALILDYGDWRSLGDTFQAVKSQDHVPPLKEPGQADLTAHVDFEPLAATALSKGCAHTRLTQQGVFLERLGIADRAQILARSVGGLELEQLVQAHRRLTHPEEMGNLFKVLGLYPSHSAPPSGLDP